VRLGGEVDHRVVARQQLRQQLGVADVAAGEAEAPRHRLEVGQVAGVGELVEDGDLGVLVAGVAAGQQRAHVVRADEPGRAGDQDPHELICTLL
jgi:hypothetical protein